MFMHLEKSSRKWNRTTPSVPGAPQRGWATMGTSPRMRRTHRMIIHVVACAVVVGRGLPFAPPRHTAATLTTSPRTRRVTSPTLVAHALRFWGKRKRGQWSRPGTDLQEELNVEEVNGEEVGAEKPEPPDMSKFDGFASSPGADTSSPSEATEERIVGGVEPHSPFSGPEFVWPSLPLSWRDTNSAVVSGSGRLGERGVEGFEDGDGQDETGRGWEKEQRRGAVASIPDILPPFEWPQEVVNMSLKLNVSLDALGLKALPSLDSNPVISLAMGQLSSLADVEKALSAARAAIEDYGTQLQPTPFGVPPPNPDGGAVADVNTATGIDGAVAREDEATPLRRSQGEGDEEGARQLNAVGEIGLNIAAWTAELSTLVYLGDVRGELMSRGLAPVANGTTCDLRWAVCDGVSIGDAGVPKLVRYVIVSGLRFLSDDPELDTARLVSQVGKCVPRPLRGVGGVRVHSGIYGVARGVLKALEPHIAATPATAELQFIGHSLGGSASIVMRALLATRDGYTPARAAQGLVPRISIFTFGSVPVTQVDPSSATQESLSACGLGQDDVHDFALPWDPIPRMYSTDDPMGKWLRSQPAVVALLEQRAEPLGSLFHGGWVSDRDRMDGEAAAADDADEEEEGIHEEFARLNPATRSSARVPAGVGALNARLSQLMAAFPPPFLLQPRDGGDGSGGDDALSSMATTGAAALQAASPIPDVTAIPAQDRKFTYQHLGTMHVIVPGRKRPDIVHCAAADATTALTKQVDGNRIIGGLGPQPQHFVRCYWSHFGYERELAKAASSSSSGSSSTSSSTSASSCAAPPAGRMPSTAPGMISEVAATRGVELRSPSAPVGGAGAAAPLPARDSAPLPTAPPRNQEEGGSRG